jgi:hypothetical protein
MEASADLTHIGAHHTIADSPNEAGTVSLARLAVCSRHSSSGSRLVLRPEPPDPIRGLKQTNLRLVIHDTERLREVVRKSARLAAISEDKPGVLMRSWWWDTLPHTDPE